MGRTIKHEREVSKLVQKYARHLEQRDINVNTNKVWAIQDVPRTWRSKTEIKVIEDGYHFAEDGTAFPNEPVEETEE